MNFTDIQPGMKIRAIAEDKTCTCYRPGDEFVVGASAVAEVFFIECRAYKRSAMIERHYLTEDEAPLFEPVTQ